MKLRDVDVGGLSAIEISQRGVRLIIVHTIGPRISWFGRESNLLFWDRDDAHRRGAWRLRGGHRLWVTRPGADESEETYEPDNDPCRVRVLPDGIAVTALGSASRIEKTLTVRVRGTEWTIEHQLRNVGTMLWAGGAWALTCTRPRRATRYRVPLGGGGPGWDALTMVIPRRWGGGHTSALVDPQIVMTEDALEIRPRVAEAKRMLAAPMGTLEMIDPELGTFRKRAPRIPSATYPLDTNVAFYLGPKRFMVELETMSPLARLAPTETLTHVETWTLV
jgi:hypothetical protein